MSYDINLSVIMIVKDEEKNLSLCLESVKSTADEIVVVDTGSTDSTKEIAAGFGARVFDEPWKDDFSATRNRSIKEARGRWLLWLDADDRLPEGELKKITSIIKGDLAAYSFIVENLFDGRKGQEFRQIRLFPNGKGIFFEGKIHEGVSRSVAVSGMERRDSDIKIIHTGYENEEDRMVKTDRNLKLLEKEYEKYPEEPAVIMELGNSYYQTGQYSRAIEMYGRINELKVGKKQQTDIFRSVPTLIGTAYYKMGDKERAKSWFENGVKRFPEIMSQYYYLGRIAVEENNADKVLEMFQTVVDLEDKITSVAMDIKGMKSNAYAYAANLYFGRGNFEKAFQLFEEADNKFDTVAFKYGPAAQAAIKTGNKAKALYFFSRGISFNDLTSEEYSDYGVLLWEQGKKEDAFYMFEKALNMNYENSSAMDNYIDIIHNTKEYKRGAEFLKNIEEENSSLEIKFFRANILKWAGNSEAARAVAMEIQKQVPENQEIAKFIELL